MLLKRYLLAHFAKSQLWHTSVLLFAFFLTEACELEARTMGFVMAGSLVLNAIVDWGLGLRWRNRVDSVAVALRLQGRGAPLTAMFFLLFCATPAFAPEWRLEWAVVTIIGFRVTYPLVDVPQNTVVALVTGSEAVQFNLLAWRNMTSGLASLSVSLLAAPLLIQGQDFLLYLIWATYLSLFVCGACWWLSRAADFATFPTGAGKEEGRRSDIDISFAAILGAVAAMVGASTVFRAMEPYYAAFAAQGVGLLVWGAVGTIFSQPLWVMYRRHGSGAGVLTVAGLMLLLAAVLLLSAIRTSPMTLMVVGVGFGIGSGGLWLMLWSGMTSRAARENATRYVGTFTCVSKLSQAAAMLLLGHVLGSSSYRDVLAHSWSPPSLLMVGALAVIAVTCLALAQGAGGFRRTASGERSAMPRPVAPTDRAPG